MHSPDCILFMFSLLAPKKHDMTHLKFRISSMEHQFQWNWFPTWNASGHVCFRGLGAILKPFRSVWERPTRPQTPYRSPLTSILNTSIIQTPKNQPKVHQEAPNLSQKLSKTLPKPSQNPLKNAIKKSIVWELVFFSNFHVFSRKIQGIFLCFLLRFEPQVHVKIHAFFNLLFVSFPMQRQKIDFVKNELSPAREHDF